MAATAPVEYSTKGLEPAPSVSMHTMPMAGLLVDVYGLDELPSRHCPVTCLWLLHPRTRTRARMADIAARMVGAWNGHRRGLNSTAAQRGVIALAFDMPNHGSRLVSEKANVPWDKGNPQHALDMLAMVMGGRGDMSALLGLAEGYLGLENIESNMCLGWSLGAHSAWEAWIGDERIDAAVAVVGCPDLMNLMHGRAKKSSSIAYDPSTFLGSKHFPPSLVRSCLRLDPRGILFGTSPPSPVPVPEPERSRLRGVLDGLNLRGKKLLLCSGGRDNLVPPAAGQATLAVLEEAASGWWKDGDVTVDARIYDDAGHEFSADMVLDVVRFVVETVEGGPRKRGEGLER